MEQGVDLMRHPGEAQSSSISGQVSSCLIISWRVPVQEQEFSCLPGKHGLTMLPSNTAAAVGLDFRAGLLVFDHFLASPCPGAGPSALIDSSS